MKPRYDSGRRPLLHVWASKCRWAMPLGSTMMTSNRQRHSLSGRPIRRHLAIIGFDRVPARSTAIPQRSFMLKMEPPRKRHANFPLISPECPPPLASSLRCFCLFEFFPSDSPYVLSFLLSGIPFSVPLFYQILRFPLFPLQIPLVFVYPVAYYTITMQFLWTAALIVGCLGAPLTPPFSKMAESMEGMTQVWTLLCPRCETVSSQEC